MKKKLLKREITICVSIAFVLYGLYILLGCWFDWIDMMSSVELSVFFPALSFFYMWFIARRIGPLRALPALLFPILIAVCCEMIHMHDRFGAIEIRALWAWMEGPKLWWPIIGYGIGILFYILPRGKATLWISVVFALYGLFMLMNRFFGDGSFAANHGWIFFPAAALLYLWFLAQRHGPLWALPALLFCMLVEVFSITREIDITILWAWADGPTLWGPIVGYVMGSLSYALCRLCRKKGRSPAE